MSDKPQSVSCCTCNITLKARQQRQNDKDTKNFLLSVLKKFSFIIVAYTNEPQMNSLMCSDDSLIQALSNLIFNDRVGKS